MKNHRPESTDEQLEQHSLPGTNMAGKGPADECEPEDKQERKPEGRENEKNEKENKATTESR